MALNVQYLDMNVENLSPAELYGFNRYEVGNRVREMMGPVSERARPYIGRNETFNRIIEQDKYWHDVAVNNLDTLVYNSGVEGHIEDWDDISDMTNISEANHLNIMTYAPVRQLMIEDRISGFGYDPDSIPEDIIGRMINNGRGEVQEDGTLDREITLYSDDLDYTDTQLAKFEKQRRMIDLILNETDLDPTDVELERF